MSLVGNGIIGIRREDKNKWERRVPLSPDHVKQLVDRGFKVLVQPSNIRVFPNEAYVEAGASLQEDLTPASLILAVKEVPIHLLIPERTYLFFSHTIKAQPGNMPLLDALLEKKVRMVDYECITVGGLRGAKRLVAFGKFAGIAGMIDFLRGMGERFLALGYSTPFLGIAATFMYPSLEAAYAAVKACGAAIAQYGLPTDICPVTAVFTGDGNVSHGAQEVYNLLPVKWVDPSELQGIVEGAKGKERTHCVYGAIAKEQHMVRKRPASPKMKAASRSSSSTGLAGLSSLGEAADASASAPAPLSLTEVLGKPGTIPFTMTLPAGAAAPAAAPAGGAAAAVPASPVFSAIGAGASPSLSASAGQLLSSSTSSSAAAAAPFNKADYRANPDDYEPIFHSTVVPYCTLLVNCMYWDTRFPRLLTIKQAADLKKEGKLRLLGISDITCDFQGSIQFLKEFTSIEAPFYVYDCEADKVQHDMDAPGILYHAVDHLPSECPRDASLHFGSCLMPFLEALAKSDGSKPFAEQSDLPVEIKGAVICAHGQLTPNFDYIAALRSAAAKKAAAKGTHPSRSASFLSVDLIGHLFDTGIVNKMLDRVEQLGASARILDFTVGKDRDTPTEMRIQLFAASSGAAGAAGAEAPSSLEQLVQELGQLALAAGVSMTTAAEDSHEHAVGIHSTTEESAIASFKNRLLPKHSPTITRRVLVLGSGFVSGPLVEYLLRRPANHLTVASMILPEAQALVKGKMRATAVYLDVSKEQEKLEKLISEHDIVVSLVPAPCHPPIARLAIAHKKDMVTASYISPEMQALHQQAAAAGVTILNEAGLDPGIDHMSARKLIEDAQAAGAVITSFSSVCGGLPAPEAANNPLGYKFSWSPRGVLTAARNASKYLQGGKTVETPGEALLASAKPFYLNPAFNLECMPNRDSLPYAEKYGIAGPALEGMFRGTLRYQGYCAHMHALMALCLLDLTEHTVQRGVSMRGLLAAHLAKGLASSPVTESSSDEELLAAAVAKTAALAASSAAHVQNPLNSDLASNPAAQAALRRFLEWCGFLGPSSSKMYAPLRGAAAGDGISSPKQEELAAAAAGGAAAGAGGAGAAGAHASPLTYVPLDTMVAVLTGKPEMFYAAGERDMALMQHTVEVKLPDGRRERHTSTLVEYADLVKNQTSMARTVGLTSAIAAQLLLDEVVETKGVLAPVEREWYAPMLEALAQEGIAMHETVEKL